MDYATARGELELMLQIDEDPVLATTDVDQLMTRSRRQDPAGNSPRNVATAPAWAASTAYVYGDVITAAGRWWACVIAGATGTVEPTWPDLTGYRVGCSQVIDNDVTWVDNGGPWAETYDLRAAAFQGWRMKAAKAAGRFDFTTDAQTFQRGMVHAHCMSMAESFKTRRIGSVESR